MASFDRNGRPVRVTDFDFDAIDGGGAELDQRLKDRLAVSEWFRQRFTWVMAGRTMQSRRIRQGIVESEIDGTSLAVIAKRLGVSRQAVHEQAKRRSQS
jgi:membrane-bound lytic murein transglycosylase B